MMLIQPETPDFTLSDLLFLCNYTLFILAWPEDRFFRPRAAPPAPPQMQTAGTVRAFRLWDVALRCRARRMQPLFFIGNRQKALFIKKFHNATQKVVDIESYDIFSSAVFFGGKHLFGN